MHEDSLVRSLWERVRAEAQIYDASKVVRVDVQLGELSGIDAHRFAAEFDLAPQPPEYQGAKLDLHVTPALWECRKCRRPFSRGEALQCEECDLPAQLVRGEERLLNRIEMEVPDELGDPVLIAAAVYDSLLARNDRIARQIRESLVAQGMAGVNIIGAPGAGRTTLLEGTARATTLELAALAAVGERDEDAARLRAAGLETVSVVSMSRCHMEADEVDHGLESLGWRPADVVFVLDGWDLRCPPLFDIGATSTVVVLPVTVGELAPLRYPATFRRADLVLVTKLDLLAQTEMRIDQLEDALARVMPDPQVLTVSAKTGQGLDAWASWLESRVRRLREKGAAMAGPALSPA